MRSVRERAAVHKLVHSNSSGYEKDNGEDSVNDVIERLVSVPETTLLLLS
ncbi:predicted protein [Pyrenophora tritici-repentis Pt-1C-BFP]|uniref:Uncharacterized protein n=1 Tax=Pyrenophora tritici-repentis (strain Pt-1C-BFP) TaxID=426418 RepID=B2WN04_PYRTR|nr:uncharacterized protein PTRG_11453 [Pyrenophora tritici-repentis Pt-1C-BFP]EDU44503.1 predicted protein [Pyrenophora tritici-repentis Pt-1C-BFP]